MAKKKTERKSLTVAEIKRIRDSLPGIESYYPSDSSWRSRRPRGPYTRDGVFVDDAPEADHPCSDQPLPLVPDPSEWSRRDRESLMRCRGNDAKNNPIVPIDIGVIDVRPNVQRRERAEGCSTKFLGWSIYSHLDDCAVAMVQDVWILGARFTVDEGISFLQKARIERQKNINAYAYGFYAPPGSIEPDESSKIVLGYDPWSLVHPGFFEAPMPYLSRGGRSIRDDRFDDAAQFAAAHIWIDQKTSSPRIEVYRRLRAVNFSMLPSGVLRAVPSGALPRSSSTAISVVAGVALGAGVYYLVKSGS
jgi:hypothetical protein